MIKLELWGHGRDNLRGVPDAIMRRLLREVRPDGLMLYLCCGQRPVAGAVNVDIDPDSKADIIADATRAPFRSGVFAFTFADPPYPKYNSQEKYGCDVIPLYSLLEEMARVTTPGGLYALLYPYRPHTLEGDVVEMHIVTPGGVHRRPRVLSVFRRAAFKPVRAKQYRKMSER